MDSLIIVKCGLTAFITNEATISVFRNVGSAL